MRSAYQGGNTICGISTSTDEVDVRKLVGKLRR